jgi:hypothetical protein
MLPAILRLTAARVYCSLPRTINGVENNYTRLETLLGRAIPHSFIGLNRELLMVASVSIRPLDIQRRVSEASGLPL